MLQELLTLNIFVFLLIFARIGTALMLMPGFGSGEVSPQIKLVIALGISFILVPVLTATMPRLPTSAIGLGILIAGEALIGAFFGSLSRIVAGALHVAGTVLSFVASLSNAFVQDPITEQQSAALSGFLSIVGMVLIFATDMHHLMLRAVIESYDIFKPTEVLLIGDLADSMARHVADAFTLGVQLSAPFIVLGMAYYVGLGILSRLMPALPVFFIGMPLQITSHLAILAIGLTSLMMVFLSRFEAVYVGLLTP